MTISNHLKSALVARDFHRLKRLKTKAVFWLRWAHSNLNTSARSVLFYVVPIRRDIHRKDVLSPKDLIKVQSRLQEILKRQSTEEANLQAAKFLRTYFPHTTKNEKVENKSDPIKSSFLTVFRLPSYLSNISYLTSKVSDHKAGGTKTTEEKNKISSSHRTKAEIDDKTRQLVSAFDRKKSRDADYIRRLENFCLHLHAYPWAQGLAVREKAVGKILSIRDGSQSDAIKVQCDEALGLVGYCPPPRSRGIRILSIDGGGMRGLIALEMLKTFELHTGKKIFELFDLICGVSTGAIIASFLGFHKKSIDDIEKTYNTLGFKIFTQNILEGAKGWVLNHSYYNTDLYEEVLKSFVGDCKMIESQRSSGPRVALVSTLVSGSRITPFVFRSYRLPYRTQSSYKGNSDTPIWAAVRASSAAPGYFNDFLLGDTVHQDGGILTNNATQIAIHEAHRIWPTERLQCVISLGLGRYDASVLTQIKAKEKTKFEARPLSLGEKFARIVDSATDTELVHETLHDLLPGQIYYRFNPYLTEYLSIDETRSEKFQLMRESTQMYMRRNEGKVRDACQQLLLSRWPNALAGDYVSRHLEKLSSRVSTQF